MLYTLEQGPVEREIIELCYRERRPLPAKIANAPQLLLGLEVFYRAFFDLTTCRQSGMAVGPIPWSQIKLYCDEFDIQDEQRADMFYQIARMDTVYIKHVTPKPPPKQPKKAK